MPCPVFNKTRARRGFDSISKRTGEMLWPACGVPGRREVKRAPRPRIGVGRYNTKARNPPPDSPQTTQSQPAATKAAFSLPRASPRRPLFFLRDRFQARTVSQCSPSRRASALPIPRRRRFQSTKTEGEAPAERPSLMRAVSLVHPVERSRSLPRSASAANDLRTGRLDSLPPLLLK
jgi:hypothetical protein